MTAVPQALLWVTVAVFHGLVGMGLVLGMWELYFGSAETECHGVVLRSCEDDQRWEWNLDSHKLHEPCSAFAPTANHSLHEYCSSARSSDGVLAEDACTTACFPCTMFRTVLRSVVTDHVTVGWLRLCSSVT